MAYGHEIGIGDFPRSAENGGRRQLMIIHRALIGLLTKGESNHERVIGNFSSLKRSLSSFPPQLCRDTQCYLTN
jgi:hypothetical protein